MLRPKGEDPVMKPIYHPTSMPILEISIKLKTFMIWGKSRITMSLQVTQRMTILIQLHYATPISASEVLISIYISLNNSKIPWLTGCAIWRKTSLKRGHFMSAGY